MRAADYPEILRPPVSNNSCSLCGRVLGHAKPGGCAITSADYVAQRCRPLRLEVASRPVDVRGLSSGSAVHCSPTTSRPGRFAEACGRDDDGGGRFGGRFHAERAGGHCHEQRATLMSCITCRAPHLGHSVSGLVTVLLHHCVGLLHTLFLTA
jgi:hypothetical protein